MQSKTTSTNVWARLIYLVGCFFLVITLYVLPMLVANYSDFVGVARHPYYAVALWASAGACSQAIYALWLSTQERIESSADNSFRYAFFAPFAGLAVGVALGFLLDFLLPFIFSRNHPALQDVSTPAVIIVSWSIGFQWRLIGKWLRNRGNVRA